MSGSRGRPHPDRPAVDAVLIWFGGACAAVLMSTACDATVRPDLVIVNAKVFTNDVARPWAEAIAIKGERVVAVGDSAAVRASAGGATSVIDAGGRVLVPGFNDARVDLPLEPPTPAGLAALDRAAITRGVTSLQVVAGGPMRSLVAAAQQAARQARWRLIRSPMDGERPQDEEPFLPPQPGERLVASGVAWALSPPWYRDRGKKMPWPGRTDIERKHLKTAVAWAYGAEDPIILAATAGDVQAYLDAIAGVGVPEVWRRKRPRLDVRDAVDWSEFLGRFVALGVVVTFVATPPAEDMPGGGHVEYYDVEDSGWLLRVQEAGVHVAFGSGRGRNVLSAMADGEAWRPGTVDRRLPAVQAATLGSAYAEKAERDKGWLGPGTLADIAILSDDIFTVPHERLASTTSVLTVVGGTIVYDAGVLPK